MKEIEQHRRMSEYSNGTNPFLVNHLHFNGMTEYGNAIILGTSEEIPDLDPHKKKYLHNLASINLYLPDNTHPMTL